MKQTTKKLNTKQLEKVAAIEKIGLILPIAIIILNYWPHVYVHWRYLSDEEKQQRKYAQDYSYLDFGKEEKDIPFEQKFHLNSPKHFIRKYEDSWYLNYSNFSNSNFYGRDFQNSNLRNSNFIEADFSKVNLKSTNLASSKFAYANLTDANLTDTFLQNTNFYGAIFLGTIITIAQVEVIDRWGHNYGYPAPIKIMDYYLCYCARQKKPPVHKKLVIDCLKPNLSKEKAVAYYSEIKNLAKQPSQTNQFGRCLWLMGKKMLYENEFPQNYWSKLRCRLKWELPGLKPVIETEEKLILSRRR